VASLDICVSELQYNCIVDKYVINLTVNWQNGSTLTNSLLSFAF